MIAETALAQTRAVDPAWPEPQRDCAGLVRFSYRAAFARLRPQRLSPGLWLDEAGRPGAFADAATLLRHSFVSLGRGHEISSRLRSGDLLAFRRMDGGEPTYHLMLVARTRGAAAGDILVVYHPGSPGESVRFGTLPALAREAPAEWRPVPDNPAFLGYFRFREWMP